MYVTELDISYETPIEMVEQFAQDHGCSATLLEEYGPAGGNPLYQFSSDNKDYLEELVMQVIGSGFDAEHMARIIREV